VSATTLHLTTTAMVNDTCAVYVLRSVAHSDRYYVGSLSSLFEFSNRSSAVAFEKYLKSGSGRAFAKRHFV
jgi:putative endonuclease